MAGLSKIVHGSERAKSILGEDAEPTARPRGDGPRNNPRAGVWGTTMSHARR
jgi:hypothetical protein